MKTVWTLHFHGRCDFNVVLDRNFATEMIQAEITSDRQAGMNRLATETLKRLEVSWPNPLSFYNSSGFVNQFYLGAGIWLATNYQTIENLLTAIPSSEPLEYNSHNVDTPSQAYALMVLFDQWVKYAHRLKES